MDESVRSRRASAFGGVAADYERGRPNYPSDAVLWLVDGARHIVDIGAGTGKLTASLVSRDVEAVALEPQFPMVARLKHGIADAHAVCAAAEALPVRNGWADSLVVAQAFHWFDQSRALPEMARTLKPGGTLGLIWNVRDESVDWVSDLARIGGSDNSQNTRETLGPNPFFDSFELRTFPMTQVLDRQALLAGVRSRSRVALMDEADRERVLGSVQRLCDTHPALAGRELFEFPYVTEAFRARRR